jgi:hypothetical protein
MDWRGFLTWIRASCQSGLSAQIKGKKLMLVPQTAEGFRATISALRSLNESKGVSFHTSLSEDRCVRLLVKNLGRHMPEDVVRKELENLGSCLQKVLQLRSHRRDRKLPNPTPNPALCVGSAGTGSSETTFPDRTRRFTCLGGDISPRKDFCSASAVNASAIRSGTAVMHPGVLLLVSLTSQGECQAHRTEFQADHEKRHTFA